MNKFKYGLILCYLPLSLLLMSFSGVEERIKLDGGAFNINGKDVQLICGEMHYARIPHEYWRDRLKRARAMGLNTISIYVFWNFHERQPGKFDFKGQADVAKFIRLAQEEDLYVILRPGPYACAEWDFGGYPSWLLKEQNMVYRSKDSRFLKYCERYIKALGKELAPLTINNGGNILMVQVENEYGSYAADKEYLVALRDMIKEAGFNVPLFTCDGGGQIEAGHINGTLPTLNGVFSEEIFKIIDRYRPGGPYFVAEFYPAWFDVWGQRHSKVDLKRPTEQLDWMLSHGVSVSMYMFHGGTNFWYTNGANTAGGYRPQPTSYDYDAPLGEWGNCYPKYFAFREIIQKYLPKGTELPDVPKDNPTTTFAKIDLKESATLQSVFHHTVQSWDVLSMEDLNVDFGYIHYQTAIKEAGKHKLIIQDLRDYAVILVDGKQVASLDRRYNQNSVVLDIPQVPAKLEILVENTGRVNYGHDIQFNRKGITNQVLWGEQKLTDWLITPLPLYKEKVGKIKFGEQIHGVPAFHKGVFHIHKKADCFVDMSRWGKGAVWVNGKSLGRFWNIGAQQTLYIPAPWLRKGKNEIIVFEMEDTGNRTLQGVSRPILDSLGVDKNYQKGQKRVVQGKPTLEKGDISLKAIVNDSNNWQEFKFSSNTTFRHFCIETLSSYTNDNQACISEIELIDDKGKMIDKTKWEIIYVSSELTEQNLGIGENIFDGDVSSFWHTNGSSDSSNPHQIIIDTKEIFKISALRIKVRSGSFLSGQVKKIQVYTRPQFFLFH